MSEWQIDVSQNPRGFVPSGVDFYTTLASEGTTSEESGFEGIEWGETDFGFAESGGAQTALA